VSTNEDNSLVTNYATIYNFTENINPFIVGNNCTQSSTQ